MGCLCGKPSKDENFHGAGRPLGSAPAPAATASVPARIAHGASSSSSSSSSDPGRTVGGAARTGDAEDARTAAARAAEARANRPVTGDLARRLEEQKRQTRMQTLQQAASENRAQREADAAAEQRNYN